MIIKISINIKQNILSFYLYSYYSSISLTFLLFLFKIFLIHEFYHRLTCVTINFCYQKFFTLRIYPLFSFFNDFKINSFILEIIEYYFIFNFIIIYIYIIYYYINHCKLNFLNFYIFRCLSFIFASTNFNKIFKM